MNRLGSTGRQQSGARIRRQLNSPRRLDLAARPIIEQLEQRLLLSQLAFAAPQTYDIGSAIYSVASADFNGDGKADLAVANFESGTVGVLLNVCTRTFATKVNYAAGGAPRSVISADFNGDGKADLAVANFASGTVSVLLNKWNSTFAVTVHYAVGDAPYSVTSADFDGDGKTDLAVANSESGTVSVLRNNGNGTFADKVDYAAGDAPYSVTSADFDGDGKADLAVADFASGTVSVLLNNGNGTFADKVDYAVGDAPYSVTSADFDGDGKADLAVANSESGTVSVLRNNGNGTFADKVDYAVGDVPYSVTSADFDGDGKADLAVANWGDDTVSVLRNLGGTFATTGPYPAGYLPCSVIAADFNRDGKADLAVANSESGTVSVLHNALLNDAPVLDPSGTMTLTSIAEDKTTANGGTLVSGIIAGAGGDPITDADSGAVEGIAVIGVDNTHGQWQYSTNGGTAWTAFGTPSDSAARLLRDTDKVRFVPGLNFNGTVTDGLTFRAWDRTSGVAGATANLSAEDSTGGTTAFSVAKATAGITVTPLNDAPVLDVGGSMTLIAIRQNEVQNGGTSISSLIASAGGDRITDVDSGAVEGIAVVGADNTKGRWEYSTDAGDTWLPLGAPTAQAARLLASGTTRIRFVPNVNFTGTLSNGITFRAWDQTAGANGDTADTRVNGGTSAYSTLTRAAGITVISPVVSITVIDNTAAETDLGEPLDTGQFRISRGQGNTYGDLTVAFSRSGTATFGTDYTLSGNGMNAAGTSVVIPDGRESVDVTVNAVDDTKPEPVETVTLTLGAGTAYTLDPVPANRSATVGLIDNEPTVKIARLQDTMVEGQSAAVFRISRGDQASLTGAVTVAFSRSGTATFGTDYTLSGNGMNAAGTSVVIPDGQRSVDVTVNAVDDTKPEPVETVTLTLGAGTAYTLDPVPANRSATVGLIDNEPTVKIARLQDTMVEGQSAAVFRISRGDQASLTGAVTVAFSRSGTATFGTDYTLSGNGMNAAGTSVVIPDGQRSVDVTVNAVDDTKPEPVETVTLTLGAGTTYTLDPVPANRSATVGLIDNEPT